MRDTEEQAPAATKAAAEDVADSYRQRMSARASVVAIHERRHAQLAWWRFAIFASGVALMVWLGRPGLPWLLVPGLAFVIAAVVHAFVLNARDRAARAVTFYERGLRRLNDEWIGTGETGDRIPLGPSPVRRRSRHLRPRQPVRAAVNATHRGGRSDARRLAAGAQPSRRGSRSSAGRAGAAAETRFARRPVRVRARGACHRGHRRAARLGPGHPSAGGRVAPLRAAGCLPPRPLC